MKSILRRRPSPALVISMVALFVSLSGVSYGVATGFIDSREIKNNEIRSLDIRNNEVRGLDIRNSTVQGRDIALNTVTGEDVKEDTLQKVPSALLADTATSAANANSVSTLKLIPRTAMAEGAAPVTLATQGPLTLSGRCEPSGSESVAELLVSTSQDDSSAGATSTLPAGATGFQFPTLNITDGPKVIATRNDSTHVRSIGITDVFASAPNGSGFTGQVGLYAESTTVGRCIFHGHLALQG